MYLFEFSYVSSLAVLIFDYLFLVPWFSSEELSLIHTLVGITFNCCSLLTIWMDVSEGFFCIPFSCFSEITFFPYTDIRERFYYIVLVVIVTLRNLTEFNWNAGECYGTLLKGTRWGVEKVSLE